MNSSRHPVVVAVGPDGSSAAVHYAASEAVRLARGLHLVHATGTPVPDPQTSRRRRADAARLLEVVAQDARRAVAGPVPVSSEVVEESPAAAIGRADPDTPLVVVGRRGGRVHVHPQLRSAADDIAAHVRVPVVSVPESWRRPASESLVVVGVDPARLSTEAVHEGFRAARERGARLLLLTSWWRPVGTDKRTALGHVDESVGADLVVEEVRQATSALCAWYGDVSAEVVGQCRPAAEALVEVSDDADLLVLGRHEPWLAAGSCIGPVARTVLRQAGCPVRVTAVHDRTVGDAQGA